MAARLRTSVYFPDCVGRRVVESQAFFVFVFQIQFLYATQNVQPTTGFHSIPKYVFGRVFEPLSARITVFWNFSSNRSSQVNLYVITSASPRCNLRYAAGEYTARVIQGSIKVLIYTISWLVCQNVEIFEHSSVHIEVEKPRQSEWGS